MGWLGSGDSLTVTLVVNARTPGTHQHCNRPGRPSDPNCANNSAAVQTRVIGSGALMRQLTLIAMGCAATDASL